MLDPGYPGGQDRLPMDLMELTQRDRDILDLERTWWSQPGSKEAAIRIRFDFSPTQYYRLLNALVDADAAEAYDPLTVRRLRRQRDSRRRARLVGRESHPGSR